MKSSLLRETQSRDCDEKLNIKPGSKDTERRPRHITRVGPRPLPKLFVLLLEHLRLIWLNK